MSQGAAGTFVHEIAFGPFTKTIYALEPERLRIETKGTIGGPSADIPLASIAAFYAYSRRVAIGGPRSALLAGSLHVAGVKSRFIVQWRDGDAIRTKRFLLNADVPSFVALLGELTRRRPDASLVHLPSEQAHAAMGIWSIEKKTRIWLLAVIGVLIGGAVIAGAILGIQNN